MKETELELLVRSRHALILLDTVEPERADQVLAAIAARLSLFHFSWSRSRGIRRGVTASDPVIERTAEPALALVLEEGAGIFHFRGLGAHLEDPLVASHVQDAVAHLGTRRGAIVITGASVHLPDALRPLAVQLSLPEEHAHRQTSMPPTSPTTAPTVAAARRHCPPSLSSRRRCSPGTLDRSTLKPGADLGGAADREPGESWGCATTMGRGPPALAPLLSPTHPTTTETPSAAASSTT